MGINIRLFLLEDNMMTSSNGNVFRVTSPLWGEFTGDRTLDNYPSKNEMSILTQFSPSAHLVHI